MAVEIHDFSRFTSNIEHVLRNTPTPTSHSFKTTEELAEIDRALIECARAWGRPFGYWQEQGGSIVQNNFPIKLTENEQISTSSRKPLTLHT